MLANDCSLLGFVRAKPYAYGHQPGPSFTSPALGSCWAHTVAGISIWSPARLVCQLLYARIYVLHIGHQMLCYLSCSITNNDSVVWYWAENLIDQKSDRSNQLTFLYFSDQKGIIKNSLKSPSSSLFLLVPFCLYPGSSVVSMTNSCQIVANSTSWIKVNFINTVWGCYSTIIYPAAPVKWTMRGCECSLVYTRLWVHSQAEKKNGRGCVAYNRRVKRKKQNTKQSRRFSG